MTKGSPVLCCGLRHPFGLTLRDGSHADLLVLIVAKLMAGFTKNHILIRNLIAIGSFPLVTVTSLFVMRRLQIRDSVALVASARRTKVISGGWQRPVGPAARVNRRTAVEHQRWRSGSADSTKPPPPRHAQAQSREEDCLRRPGFPLRQNLLVEHPARLEVENTFTAAPANLVLHVFELIVAALDA